MKFNTEDQDQAIQVVHQTLKCCTRHSNGAPDTWMVHQRLKWCTRHYNGAPDTCTRQSKQVLHNPKRPSESLSWVIGFIIGGDYSNELKYTVYCTMQASYICSWKIFSLMVGTKRHIITLASCESPPHPATIRQHQLRNGASGHKVQVPCLIRSIS